MKKILVIQTASIGDVILATALPESLHSAFPESAIDLLVKQGNESLFSGHPFLHEVIVWNKKHKKHSNLFKIINKIRKTKYDLVVDIQRFFTSGLITVLSGAKETRGFSKNPLSWLFTKKVTHEIGRGVHEVVRNHRLIIDLVGGNHALPRLYPGESDENFLQTSEPGNFYTISPASLWFTKQYPVSKWGELIGKIPSDSGIYLLGSPTDQPLCNEIMEKSPHPGLQNLAGKLSLLQSAALMKKAAMNFTNDSAPMHLASAVNARVTVVYCSTIPAFGFGPLSTDSVVVEVDNPLPCRPCGLHGYKKCPETHFRCAYQIETGKLAKRLQ